MRRIVRVSVYHAGTFRAMLEVLREAEATVSYRGQYYRLLDQEGGVALYQRIFHPLHWLRMRVADYEAYMAARLAQGVIGEDGVLRARTSNVIRTRSGYRQRRFW